ncbi:MAG TPA: hypothetical protein VGE52_07580 [Pirellulales bacterium]
MLRLLLLCALALFMGCDAGKKEVLPTTDAARIKAEQEKNAQMMKDTGEQRVGKPM